MGSVNERITALAEQAGFENGHQDRYGNSLSQELEKFAELIVRACATKANATALDLRLRPELVARRYVGEGILKCFGVEE